MICDIKMIDDTHYYTYAQSCLLAYCILSFTLQMHAMLQRIIQLPTSVGLAEARPNEFLCGL